MSRRSHKGGTDLHARWVWGGIRDCERRGTINRTLDDLVSGMAPSIQDDVRRILPRVLARLKAIRSAARECLSAFIRAKDFQRFPITTFIGSDIIQLREPLLSALAREIDIREGCGTPFRLTTATRFAIDVAPKELSLMRQIIDGGYRTLAKTRRPNTGGMKHQMVHVNAVVAFNGQQDSMVTR